MGEIEVLDGPLRSLIFCLPVDTGSEKSELIAKRFLLLTIKMARIIPPFGFEFWMGKMVLGKREGSSGESAFEFLAKKRRSRGNKGQDNYKTTDHCKPKAKQSHPTSVSIPPLSTGGEGGGEGDTSSLNVKKILSSNQFPIVKGTSNNFQSVTYARDSLKIATS